MPGRHLLRCLIVAALFPVAILAGCAAPGTTPGAEGTSTPPPATPVSSSLPTTRWPEAIPGFEHPTSIVAPDDGSGTLFVTDQPGRVLLVRDGVLAATPALDIRAQVGSTGNEQGLLCIAFPPRFAEKRYAYLDFTDTSGDTRIYRVHSSAADTYTFDPARMDLIIKIAQPYANHNGGQLAFGPDGCLYIGMGDGGSARDPERNGQNLGTLLGKILRIDVESTPDAPGYRVPPGNPFVGQSGAKPEVWAYGLRNPWRFSFDGTGALWIGDVGQDAWEEVDRLDPGQAGANLGWSLFEGNHPMWGSGHPTGFVWPIVEYAHPLGECVTGGYVYAGAAYPGMRGLYVYGDYVKGQIWTLTGSGSTWTSRLARQTSCSISTFGVDGDGELWAADWAKGTIHRLGDLSK